jgi:hypothetical protein
VIQRLPADADTGGMGIVNRGRARTDEAVEAIEKFVLNAKPVP